MTVITEEKHEDIEPQMKGEYMLNRNSMFLPKSPEEIMTDYPELRKYDCFKDVFPKDVVFCWYMCHRSSPVLGWDDAKKTEFSIKRAYVKLPESKYRKIISGEYSEEMREAMLQMSSFMPNVRARLNKMNEKILLNWEKIVNENTELKDKEYVDATSKIRKEMPDLLKQVESNLSMVSNEDALEESDEIGLLDNWHNEKGNKNSV